MIRLWPQLRRMLTLAVRPYAVTVEGYEGDVYYFGERARVIRVEAYSAEDAVFQVRTNMDWDRVVKVEPWRVA